LILLKLYLLQVDACRLNSRAISLTCPGKQFAMQVGFRHSRSHTVNAKTAACLFAVAGSPSPEKFPGCLQNTNSSRRNRPAFKFLLEIYCIFFLLVWRTTCRPPRFTHC